MSGSGNDSVAVRKVATPTHHGVSRQRIPSAMRAAQRARIGNRGGLDGLLNV
jgi:hypothetical protein